MTKQSSTDRLPNEENPPADHPVPSSDPEPKEIGGRNKGLEPTRYGDWEKNGRCIDF